MKTKESEIQKRVKSLCDAMGEKDRFFVFRNNENHVTIALPDDDVVGDKYVSASLAWVMQEYLLGGGDKGIARLSEIIINAIEALIAVSPNAASKIIDRFITSSLDGIYKNLEKHKDSLFKSIGVEDDQDGVDDGCEDCKYVKTCDDDKAVKYRKEHGIPKPKQNKKKCNGKKINVD